MTKSNLKIVRDEIVNVGFDVSAETLNWTVLLPGDSQIDGQCLNTTDGITDTLNSLQKMVDKHMGSACELRIICESTGVYHRALLNLAGVLGMRTNLVSGEAVAHCRQMTQNDGNKTDLADPKAILTVAKMGKLIKHRIFESSWSELRELHRVVISAEEKYRVIKNELHAELKSLFPDLKLSKDVLWGSTGTALFHAFGGNPLAIVKAGRTAFDEAIKKLSKHTKRATLNKIWAAAERSAKHGRRSGLAEVMEQQVRFQFDLLKRLEQQKDRVEAAMVEIYRELQKAHPELPSETKGVFSDRLLARLFAEIGPPTDFQSWRQLLRYAGLNLIEKQSGKYRGKTKISRRGRARIRDILNRMSLPLTKKTGLFGDYYHGKKDGGMPGNKAMVAVMRKLLKMIWGLCQSQAEFDSTRVQTCLRDFEKLVA